MSSSNLVRVAVLEEATYGVTPGTGNFSTARFTSESLSGTPETKESAQIRTDRMSSGQVSVGLKVEGDLNFELAKESVIDGFIESAMLSEFSTPATVTVGLTLVASTGVMTRASGDFTLDVKVGDVITFGGFTDAANNTTCMVSAVTDATHITIIPRAGMVNGTGVTTTYQIASKIGIGTTKKSFSMEKYFSDLTTKAINYTGMLVSTMKLSIKYGDIITGSFGFMGNGYEAVSAAGDMITDGRTVDAAATSLSMNGSIDMPFVASDLLGTLSEALFCIQGVELSLDNNLGAQTCIGEIAPADYRPGQAKIDVSIDSYLSNANWSMLAKKLTQAPIALGFMVENSGGKYAFYMPAIQLSFPDPSSAGANQDISLSMKGMAKVGSSGQSALTIYKI